MEGYLEQADKHKILILFYERLKQNFNQELILLLDYLGFSFSESERNRISQKTSSSRMRKKVHNVYEKHAITNGDTIWLRE